MARIVLGSYLVRYPLGGMMSWVLQYLVGFARLGHDVYFVEKADYPNACFDPARNAMTNDGSFGMRATQKLLSRFDLGDRWCFADYAGEYHGLSKLGIEDVLATADVFIDMGTHGAWLPEAAEAGQRVLIDGEPAFTQLKMQRKAHGSQPQAHGSQPVGSSDAYDHYYTTGWNIGTPASSAPTAGREWRHLFHPVCTQVFPFAPAADRGSYTTVMNWQSYEPIRFNGTTYHHKDVEFQKFLGLPKQSSAPLEVAVSGAVPREELRSAGWKLESAHRVTQTFDAFQEYLRASRGEFSVCKNGYVASNSGWFSDRSAAYLSTGRPVVLQETGFSAHLPTGRGLFAVRDADEAAAALEKIESDYTGHARWAREIAEEFLDVQPVLDTFLKELGIESRRRQLTGVTA